MLQPTSRCALWSPAAVCDARSSIICGRSMTAELHRSSTAGLPGLGGSLQRNHTRGITQHKGTAQRRDACLDRGWRSSAGAQGGVGGVWAVHTLGNAGWPAMGAVEHLLPLHFLHCTAQPAKRDMTQVV